MMIRHGLKCQNFKKKKILTFPQMRANMIVEKSATDRRLVRYII